MEQEEKRKRAELGYRTILRTAKDGFWLVDMQGRFLDVNDSYCRLIGYSRDELLKMSIQNVEVVETQEETAQHIKRVIEVGWDRFETRHRCKDGSIVDIEVSANHMDFNGGRFFVFLRDIAEHKRAEAALKYRLEVEKIITNISTRFIGLSDFDKAIYTSLADISKLSGASRSYLFLLRDTGTIMDNTHEWCADGVTPEIQNLQNLPVSVYPWWMKKLRAREVIHITDVSGLPPEAAAEKEILEMQNIKSLLVMPVYAGAELAGFIGFDNIKTTGFWREGDVILLHVASDIIGNALHRMRIEETLKKSEERLQLQIYRMPMGCIMWDIDFRVISWNPAAEEIFGFKSEEVLGKHPYDLIVPKDAQLQVDTIWRRLLKGDSTAHIVNENITKYGSTIICSWSNTPLKEADGSVIGVLSMVQDITERKRSEMALRESEERFRSIAERSFDTIVTLNPEGRFTYVSPAGKRMGGFNPEEIIGKPFQNIILESDIPGAIQIFSEVMKGNNIENIQVGLKRRDGTLTSIEGNASPIIKEGKVVGAQGIFRDITENKRAEEALRQSEEKHRILIENIQDGVFIIQDAKVQFANEAFARIGGYTVEEAIGMDFMELVAPEDLEMVASNYQRRQAGENIPNEYEFSILRKDKTQATVNMNVGLITYCGRVASMGTVKDITERKKAEQIRIDNERLVYASKAKSEFLTSMSHELRTPLNAIIGFSQLLEAGMGGELKEKQKHYINNITNAGTFLLNLINDILDLSKIEAGKIELNIEEIPLQVTVEETITLIKEKAMKHNIIIKKEFEPGLDLIYADKQRVKQILFNLLSNAIKFSKDEGGTITISTRKVDENVQISVCDTGIGIKPENIEKLFKKFEQLDKGISQKYGGTGLGLEITKQLVEQHGGRIWAESKYGESSTFTFLLPLRAENGEIK